MESPSFNIEDFTKWKQGQAIIKVSLLTIAATTLLKIFIMAMKILITI